MCDRVLVRSALRGGGSRILVALSLLSLAACGGGGGSSGSGTGGSGSGSGSGSSGGSGSSSSYTVSGTITGLNNAGLKLQDYSGGETLAVSAGATSYQFTQSVPSGTDVQVKVTAQPSLQTCAAGASNFSGPISANITTDTFSCTTLTATVSTLAGSSAGNTDGTGTTAEFDGPIGVAVDSSGALYVADSTNNEIRKIVCTGSTASTCTVTTLAGLGPTQGGDTNGPGTSATFNYPTGVAVDSSGNLYVADFYNNQIRKIVCTGSTASTCTVSTFAGSGAKGNLDGVGTAAEFDEPSGVAVDSSGNVYVADYGNNEIRKITPAGDVTTLAGSGAAGNSNGSGTSATFNGPAGVAVDSSGNVYVADFNNSEIRMINASDVVSTLAGSGTAGNQDGMGTAAEFDGPNDVAVDSAGNVYVADSKNNEIRLVAPTGLVSTLAGTGTAGNLNGSASAAEFDSPSGVAVSVSGSTAGNVYVGDLSNNQIRQIVP